MAYTHDTAADHTLTLSDGRVLGYSEFGDPAGYPILNNHGGLVCRLDVEPVHEQARDLGVRIISPDRPGVATSDRKPDRDTLDWADDVRELLDALDIHDFANMGWSMGGQYALAVAHAFGDRVKATAVIAGCPPLDDEEVFAELNDMDQELTKMSANHPAAARTAFAAIGKLEGHFPERMAKLTTRKSAPTDRDATIDNADWMGEIMSAAAADTHGLVDEYLAWVKPWRFELADVTSPVAIWQGTADTLVVPDYGQRLADGIPGAELHLVDGEGHLIGLTHRVEVLQHLLEVVNAS